MSVPAVEFRNVSMHFGSKVAVHNVDLAIDEGSFVVVLGPSGGGKTTLLNILGGFLEPTEGSVFIDGAEVTHMPPARRPTTTVFQDYALFPHMSIAGNVGFGLKMRNVPKAERDERIRRALDMVGLSHTAARKTHQLSGGQRQRIALARALVVEPKVLLLDEPLGALDLKLRRQMQEELKAIQKRVGTTFVHVTHDQEEAMAIGDVVVVMNDGFIEDIGAPERVYLRPASLFTATFMGDSNLLEGRIGPGGEVATDLGALPVETKGRPGEPVTLILRPEQLALAPKSDAALSLGRARIVECLFQGTQERVRARAETGGGQELMLRLDAGTEVTAGDTVEVYAEPADVVVLRAPASRMRTTRRRLPHSRVSTGLSS